MTDPIINEVTYVVYEDDPLGKFRKGAPVTERQARDYNIPLEPDGTSLADRERQSPLQTEAAEDIGRLALHTKVIELARELDELRAENERLRNEIRTGIGRDEAAERRQQAADIGLGL